MYKTSDRFAVVEIQDKGKPYSSILIMTENELAGFQAFKSDSIICECLRTFDDYDQACRYLGSAKAYLDGRY